MPCWVRDGLGAVHGAGRRSGCAVAEECDGSPDDDFFGRCGLKGEGRQQRRARLDGWGRGFSRLAVASVIV